MTDVVITGGDGFLGRHVVDRFHQAGHRVFTAHKDVCDLTDRLDVEAMFDMHQPELVVHLAAEVGGIGANQANPGFFWYANLMMGLNILEQCRLAGTEKLVIVGTICAYPKLAPIPFKEEDLWNGYPEETNAPYGIAKKALLTGAQAYREQYGLNSIYLLPVNLYGPCFSADTEVLTPLGARNVRDIREGDPVYSLNPDTHEVELATVVGLTRTTTSKWVTFNSAGVDFQVTPDHMIYYHTSTGYRKRPAEWFGARAAKHRYGRLLFAHHKPVKGGSTAAISLEPYVDTEHIRNASATAVRDFKHSHSKSVPLEFGLNDFAEFVGWYVTEGCARHRATAAGREAWEIAIAQQGQHRERIGDLLTRMGITWTASAVEFHFSSRLFANYVLAEIGLGCEAKRLPPACFGWSLEARLRLLKAMMDGDGNATGGRYTTKSRQLADDFCHLAFTCGWKARIARNDGSYRISIRRKRVNTEVKYPGINSYAVESEAAYCFTLDRNHIVYAGRNDRFNWIGQCDHFDLENSHVIAALIRKMVDAVEDGADTVTLWGDGTPTREFLYAPDAAEAILLASERYDGPEPVNLGSGYEISIRRLAYTIAGMVGFKGEIVWDETRPNGQPRRQLDVTRARDWFGFTAKTSLGDGLLETIDWYTSQPR